ncbi:MAG: glycosyltransferase [Clostridiales bacterium]|nr:glycosyltransferase [Clostridiales bacterium]
MDITILFPVLNEKLRLKKGIVTTAEYLRKNCSIPYKLMILDNGSTDETPQIAQDLCKEYEEAVYVRVEERGVGVAFREGIKRNTSDIVGYMDIDLSTNIRHLGEAIRIFENREDIEYINGTRFSRESDTQGRKWYRKVTSKGLLVLLKTVLGMKSTDAVCGFTFMRKNIADKLVEVSGNENGWFYTIEMLLRAERMGVRILDMPVEWQEDYNTTVKIIKTVKNYMIQIRRLHRQFREEDKADAKKN